MRLSQHGVTAMDEKRKPIGTGDTRKRFCADSIFKIAAAANVEISEATAAAYLEQLISLSTAQMAVATTKTIREWVEPSKMPPIAFILERGYAGISPEVANDTPRILDRALPGEVENRERREEFSARIIREMQEKYGLGASNEMPSAELPHDPAERKAWATAMAKKQGWR